MADVSLKDDSVPKRSKFKRGLNGVIMESVLESVAETKPLVEFSPGSTAKLFGAIAKFHKTCPVIGKDKNNTFFKAKYADLGSILGVVNPLLAAQGLVITQFALPDHQLCTQVSHESGEWMRSTYSLKPQKNDPQGIGSAMTYQRRYAVCAILSLAIDDEDDDGQAANQPAKTQSNPDKLRQQLSGLCKSLGRATAESLIVESEGRFKLDSGKPLTKLTDVAVINNEDTLKALIAYFSQPQDASK
jgi:hypothetical protein